MYWVERYESKFDKVEGCWEWKASKTWDGYGRIYFDGKQHLAHRVSYELYEGPVKDLLVLHRCDNPGCVNPEHLFLGTNADNMQDKLKKGRAKLPLGEQHKLSKLKEEQVQLIRLDTRTHLEISKEYGVCRQMIGHIKTNKNWRHI